MSEQPEEIKRSWALQSSFMTGPVVINKLVPAPYGKIRTNFVQTWREESQPAVDWGVTNQSMYIPESIRCVSAVYLKINLGAAKFKAYPGLYIIKTFRLRSAGQIVYECDYAQFLVDYCESISDQKLRQFAAIYLGGSTADVGTASTRSVKLPLLIPNSTYMRRSSNSTAGHGVFGTSTGNQRIELEVTLNTANFACIQGASGADLAASVAGSCSLMFHTVDVPRGLREKYEDVRGAYSVVCRRFTQLNSDWVHYATANALVTEALAQPTGTCTEVMILAVPHEDNAEDRRCHNYVKPTHFEIVADSLTQKLLDTPEKISTELFTNGFNPPSSGDFDSPGRLCFASHCSSDSTAVYAGGYNMTMASTIQFKFKFAQAVDYRLVAVQLSRAEMDAKGILHSSI